MSLGVLRDTANWIRWIRFDYHRSFRRANRPQMERYVTNLVRRPELQNPRRLISIGLTHRCQSQCEWCATGAYRKDAKGELTTEEVERLLREIARSRFVFNNVSFLGGECLLRSDLDHLVRYATDLGLFVHLSTNGLKLDEARVRRLMDAGLNSVFVAFDPGTPRDDKQRKRTEAVLAAVEGCVRLGLPCFFSVCVCKENVFSGDIEATIELGRQLGIAGVRLMPIRLSGNWLREDLDKVLDAREEAELRRLCTSGFAFITDDAARSAGRTCAAVAQRIVYLSPYGEVQPCHFFPFSFGNVRADALDSVLTRMWSHRLVRSRCDDCLLHDRDFRARYITPMRPGVQLPVSLVDAGSSP
jgi:MoaA/NifB/PqqE/SkfB family radical SAM enzyme